MFALRQLGKKRFYSTTAVTPTPTPYTPPTNKDSALREINFALNASNGFVETGYTVPPWRKIWNTNFDTNNNPYGHSFIRYVFPNGEDHLVNIVNNKSRQQKVKMVNFVDPTEYFFGDPTKAMEIGSEQGGIHKRSFTTLRIENVNEENLKKLHDYFLNLKERDERGETGFALVIPHILNFFGKFMKWPEYGNCATWSSRGLKNSGIIDFTSMFPKFLILKMFAKKVSDSKLNVISYQCIDKTLPRGGTDMPFGSWTNPIKKFTGVNTWDLTKFSDVNVYLNQENKIIVERKKGWREYIPEKYKGKVE